MNRRVMHRPMFRKGGSASEGITSGLRQGYSTGKRVQEVLAEMQQALPQRNRRRNLNDFLISFGLDLASRSPQGNILQTAAMSAKEPFAQFQQAAAGDRAFDDKLALGAYDIVKGEQQAAKDFQQKKDLIAYEAEVNPILKKVFREEIPEVMINEESKVYLENEHDVISSQARQIAKDVVTFELFRKDNPEDPINEKQFIGVLRYGYGKKGESVPNYSNIAVGQIFYNPEDNYFYERISDKTGTVADFKALDPFTYD